ncbi:MAG: DNA primase [Azospira oryzae]|nr:MAG: DNA primase [Azospira oryzae]
MSRLSFKEAKQISIVEYLSGLGFEAAKIRDNDFWYYSPFREERTPSFKVDIKQNIWYDHGSGEGGTILDLGAKLHHCTLSEFLDKLSGDGYGKVISPRQSPSIKEHENKLEVLTVAPLTDQNLLHYLSLRGISRMTGQTYCQEIDFRIKQKQYKAIGFPNRSGAYELRNSWFKGSSSPKDISLISNHSDKVSVLEGFMDFLSVQQLSEAGLEGFTAKNDFLILNSLQLLKRSLPVLQSYKEINLLLDNDPAAHDSKKYLTQNGITYHDCSNLYHGHKDINDFLKAVIRQDRERLQIRTRSI